MKVNEKENLPSRINAIRDRLPKNYRVVFARYYPEYSSITAGNRISNVMKGRVKDVEIITRLEKIFGVGGRYWKDNLK